MSWSPTNWFNNRVGGMDDGASENFFDMGGVRETVFDGGPDTTTTYDNWAKYEAGQPSGSYNWGGGGFSGGFSKNFNNALNFLKSYPGGREKEEDDPYKPINLGGAGGGRTQALEGSHSMYIPGAPIATVIPAQQSSGGGGFLGGALKLGGMLMPGPVGTAMKVGSMFV